MENDKIKWRKRINIKQTIDQNLALIFLYHLHPCYVKRRKDIIGRIKIDGTDKNDNDDIDAEGSTDLRHIICSD